MWPRVRCTICGYERDSDLRKPCPNCGARKTIFGYILPKDYRRVLAVLVFPTVILSAILGVAWASWFYWNNFGAAQAAMQKTATAIFAANVTLQSEKLTQAAISAITITPSPDQDFSYQIVKQYVPKQTDRVGEISIAYPTWLRPNTEIWSQLA
jgi:hypothetical protein